jgi:glutathione S-transferase
MLEAIPNVFKRERRRDVIEKGTQSQHFIIAVQRMTLLLDEMEEALAAHRWLACDAYTLADVAFTPYLARLEHLDILGMIGELIMSRTGTAVAKRGRVFMTPSSSGRTPTTLI